jgi:hypothetical protein
VYVDEFRTTGSLENPFYSPFGTVLIKAEESHGKWWLYLQASSEVRDQESEVLLCKALKDSADYYLSHGILSWNHKHKALHDPAYIIGEPTDVAFNDANQTLVKGFLYQKNRIAKSVWENIESGAKKLGASVGGGVVRKSKDKSTIERVIWDETAITHQPVNDDTLGRVTIIPFPEFAKALMAGSGVDASTFTGGRALTPESLQGAQTPVQESVAFEVPYEEARRLFDGLWAEIKRDRIHSYNDVVAYVLAQGYERGVAAQLISYISKKIPGVPGIISGGNR